MIMLTLGTGVGGAVIIDGQLLIGGRGAAGELGHVRFERDGRPCGCGLRGCLEQYASGRALQREAADLADDPELGTGLAGVRDASGVIHGDAISRLILGGDPGALEALRRVATALGETAGGFQAAFDPEIFVIGGGVAQLGETLLAPVRERYRASLPGGANAAGADFAIATLGNDAGLIGVADLAGGR